MDTYTNGAMKNQRRLDVALSSRYIITVQTEKELTMTEENSTAIVAQTDPTMPSQANVLAIISKAASDPTIDPAKLHSLLDFQERVMDRQAEMDFNQAFTRLQIAIGKIRINKSGKISVDGRERSRYATYEDIDKAIRPELQKEGFALRFSSLPEGGKLVVKGTLSHIGGHSIETCTPMSIDANPKVMNAQQAIGSASSYAQRYIVKLLLNLVFEGEDDDGAKASFKQMTDDQAQQIRDALRSKKALGRDVKKFLAHMGVDEIEKISAADFNKALIAISNMAVSATEE